MTAPMMAASAPLPIKLLPLGRKLVLFGDPLPGLGAFDVTFHHVPGYSRSVFLNQRSR